MPWSYEGFMPPWYYSGGAWMPGGSLTNMPKELPTSNSGWRSLIGDIRHNRAYGRSILRKFNIAMTIYEFLKLGYWGMKKAISTDRIRAQKATDESRKRIVDWSNLNRKRKAEQSSGEQIKRGEWGWYSSYDGTWKFMYRSAKNGQLYPSKRAADDEWEDIERRIKRDKRMKQHGYGVVRERMRRKTWYRNRQKHYYYGGY